MNASNRYFNNISRAPYELTSLIQAMPQYLPSDRILTEDEQLMAAAANKHVSNATDVLLSGIEALGHVLFSAANNDNFPPAAQQLQGLGALITHLAVELQSLKDTEESMSEALRNNDLLIATEKRAGKGGAA